MRGSGTRSRCPSAEPDRPYTDSSCPSTANDTPAAWRQVATARATFWLRVSKAAAQPTQYSTSRSSRPPSAASDAMVGTSNGNGACPVEPLRGRLTPRVPLPFHGTERRVELLREPRLLEHEVATQPDDLVDVLDQHRTGLDAGAAGHAVPHRVVRDRVIDDGLDEGRLGRPGVVEPVVSRTIGEFGMRLRPCSASTDMSRMPMMKVLGLSGFPVL